MYSAWSGTVYLFAGKSRKLSACTLIGLQPHPRHTLAFQCKRRALSPRFKKGVAGLAVVTSELLFFMHICQQR